MKPPVFFESENITLKIINEEIVHTCIKDFKIASIKDAKEIHEFLITNYKDQNLVSLFEFGVDSTINRKLREYLADPDRDKYSNKIALLVKNLNQQLVGSSFLKYQNPSFPSKVFYEKQKAIDWLLED
jgi:hypothetical protein